MYRSKNPANGELISKYKSASDKKIDKALKLGQKTFHKEWSQTSIGERADIIFRAAEILRTDTMEYAKIATLEMGKPIIQAKAEVEKCAWLCEYFAENAARFLSEKIVQGDDLTARVWYQPLGTVFGVMPWNYPYWQAFRYAIPTIMAGNVAILKPASNVPGCGQYMENLLLEAGAPEGVFQTLFVDSDKTEQIIKHSSVCGIALTGSGPAGGAVASLASKYLKRSVLELGGSDAFIVLDDADIDAAAEMAVQSRMKNNGQTCIASKRWIVTKGVADEFREAVTKRINELVIGDPMDENVDISCMARADLMKDLEKQVKKTIKKGGKVLVDGGIINREGNYFAPMFITDIPKKSPAYEDELFGPVACLFEVEDEQAAIKLANDSVFGLGAAVWSQDRTRALRVARQLEAGAISINTQVSSDPRLPFGGIKESGYGRELAEEGIREFVNVKSVKIEN